jgi:ABC-type glutathione transport system ATPase component
VSEEPLLELKGISKRFEVGGIFRRSSIKALDDVSLTLGRGEIIAIVGESGSGKSTLARVIARLERPDTGSLSIDGRDVLAVEPRASLAYRRRIQMIFQDPFGSLNPAKTVAQHVERPLIRCGVIPKRRGIEQRVHTLLKAVGLEPAERFARQRPGELSGGQRQRVAIARALAVEPDVILADEPTSMLDVSLRAGILNLLGSLRKERGTSLILITHDLASARYLADRILVMYQGRIVEQGSAARVVEDATHPYTRQLMAAAPGARPLRAAVSAN